VTSLAAILDIDGTLVDTNYQHALAWYRAFRQSGVLLPIWRIHRHIGMGADQLIEALAGKEVEREKGEDLRAAEKALYLSMIEEVELMPGARRLIGELRDRDCSLVLASSAKPHEAEHYLDLLDARRDVDAWTTSADVQATKPHPDLITAAMERVDADQAVMVGDSTWDCEAAKRADLPTLALLTGGFSEQELREAGAESVFESLNDLVDALDDTALGTASKG